MPAVSTIEDTVMPKVWYEEILLHEFMHMAQHTRGALEIDHLRWEAAVAKDNNYITSYARGNRIEDHADSFVAWLIWRRYEGLRAAARAHIRRVIRWRIAYFDREHRRLTLRQPESTCVQLAHQQWTT